MPPVALRLFLALMIFVLTAGFPARPSEQAVAAAQLTPGASWRDRAPVRFQQDAAAIVRFTTPAEIQQRCPFPPGSGLVAVACTAGLTVYLPNPCTWSDPYAVLACHELGHVNGWSGAHER